MPTRLCTEAELEAAFAAEEFLLFKHSPRCGISAAAFAEFQRFASDHPELSCGWIDVLEERALARAVSARTGIPHESPQAIWLARGAPRWSAAHGAITARSLASARGSSAARPSA